ncbi:LysR family transcriptional regulator [Paenibacillus sp. MBLB4367]|uniref:LysR family transcriptional regulator n=1 Tax=Paenibacillus sp. MBLB4367 TaxID=3384767 RepID=UPI0039082DB6
MYLEQLECIVEVAKTGSLTGAAQNSHITLSAVSQAVSSLEAELGIVLFTRSRTGSVPTAEGQRIIRIAFDIVSKVRELKNEAVDYAGAQSGHLAMATIPGPLSLAVDAIMEFKKDYPGIALEIIEEGTAEILDHIRHNRVDLGLTVVNGEYVRDLKGLTFGKLMEAKMVVAVCRHSPLAFRTSISHADLAALPLVLYKDETVKAYMEDVQARYGTINVLFSTNNTDTIRKVVSEGSAATIGLDFSFIGLPSYPKGDMVTIPLEQPADQKPIYLGWLRSEEKHFSIASRLFIDRLKHALEKSKPL